MEDKECYVGIKSCGCLVAISLTMDSEIEYDWLESEYKIERMNLDEAKSKLQKCTHE